MTHLVDLAMSCFDHCSHLGDLWRWIEPGELVGDHGEIGAWRPIDVLVVNVHEICVEVMTD